MSPREESVVIELGLELFSVVDHRITVDNTCSVARTP